MAHTLADYKCTSCGNRWHEEYKDSVITKQVACPKCGKSGSVQLWSVRREK